MTKKSLPVGVVTGCDALLGLHVDAWVASPWGTMHKRALGSKVPIFNIVGRDTSQVLDGSKYH